MLAKKPPFIRPAVKHQNAANLMLQTYEKNQQTFLWYHTGVDFNPRNNFTSLGYFAKVSVPVESIIPLFNVGEHLWSCLLNTLKFKKITTPINIQYTDYSLKKTATYLFVTAVNLAIFCILCSDHILTALHVMMFHSIKTPCKQVSANVKGQLSIT